MSIKGEITQALCRRVDGVGPARAKEIVEALVEKAKDPNWAQRYAMEQIPDGEEHTEQKLNDHMLQYWYVLDFIKEWA